MIVFETYIHDPVLHNSVRIAEDDGGMWYAFLSDGAELLADSWEDLSESLARYWTRILVKEATA